MKRTIALFLSITFLFTGTQIGELLKLPILATHYFEHQDENPNLSFIDFIRSHYLHRNLFDDDVDNDNNLPFKSQCSCNCSNISILQPNESYELPRPNFSEVLQKSENHRYHCSFSTNFLISIWQPPKFIFSFLF